MTLFDMCTYKLIHCYYLIYNCRNEISTVDSFLYKKKVCIQFPSRAIHNIKLQEKYIAWSTI